MALIQCKECGKRISKKTKECPKCGAPQGSKYTIREVFYVFILLVFIYSLFSGESTKDRQLRQEKKIEKQNTEIKRKDTLYFNQSKEEIVKDLNHKIQNKEYQEVLRITSKYFAFKGEDMDMHSMNYTITELVKKNKQDKIKREKEYNKNLTELIAKFGKRPVTRWDGGYQIIKNYLQIIAKDPDSVKLYACSKFPRHTQNGWLVFCKWRAKNSFGAMNSQINWFIIRNSKIISMEEASMYDF